MSKQCDADCAFSMCNGVKCPILILQGFRLYDPCKNLMRTYMATQDGRPILTQLNNGIINARAAMPLKDLNSDNDASFELNRKIFNKSYQPPIYYNTTPIGRSFLQRKTPAIQHGFVIDGPKSVQQKKWIGGNRDASHVAESRRKRTTGQILTYSGPQSFTNTKDTTTRIDALARVRGGGARVPMKVSKKNVIQGQFNIFSH